MWAIVNQQTDIVEDIVPPDHSYDQAVEIAKGRLLIKMSPENSPGYLFGTYRNKKFYPRKEVING
jgi:hypothetical protein